MRTEELFAWIKERHSIYTKRAAGLPKPWTQDKILQSYRFCNVYRELDTVTQWIRKEWCNKHDTDPNLWFAMAVARLVNWPETLEAITYPDPWRPARFTDALHTRRKMGWKAFSGAYIVSTNGHAMDKADYLVRHVLQPLWDARRDVPRPDNLDVSLNTLHQWLMKFDGLGSFIAAQVIADVKYQTRWRGAADWNTFAASGPGSRRGLNRVFDICVERPWREAEWKRALLELKAQIDPLVAKAKMPLLHAQDLQNCLCEFDKMERVRLGEGKPRSKYPGGA